MLLKTLMIGGLCIAVFDVTAATADDAIVASAGSVAPPAASVASPMPAQLVSTSAPAVQHFEIGDKVKLMFYERLNNDEANKWGNSSGENGFQQRPELSGDFTIEDDGTISLPLLGSFAVENQTAQSLQSALATAFKKLTKRDGFVTILSLERPPVYVLGPVKNPGSYKYVPGMTVLHAIALAGGYDQQRVEPWEQIQTVQESTKRIGAYETIAELLAREAVLKAERDHVTAQPPLQLVDLVGASQAKSMVGAEVQRRLSIVEARRSQENALSQSVTAAQQELQMMANHLRPLDDLIKMRSDHVNAYRSLMSNGTLSRQTMMQAQGELSDTEMRRQDAVNQIALAKERVGQLTQDKARFDAQTRGDLETAIAAIDQQIAANTRDGETSTSILGALKATQIQYAPVAANDVKSQKYEVVRQTASGPISITAIGMTTLRPGDLVRIMAGAPHPAPGSEVVKPEPTSASRAIPISEPVHH